MDRVMSFPANILGFLFRQPTEQTNTKVQSESLLPSQKSPLPLNHSDQQLPSRSLSQMRVSSLDTKDISTYLSGRTTLEDVYLRNAPDVDSLSVASGGFRELGQPKAGSVKTDAGQKRRFSSLNSTGSDGERVLKRFRHGEDSLMSTQNSLDKASLKAYEPSDKGKASRKPYEQSGRASCKRCLSTLLSPQLTPLDLAAQRQNSP